ncbi:hypothetical protein PHYSODRAFT_331553 [Phytophthora sojae]|uniref:Uncharacterized protein n=1 Tax=Phytophthora sojae (strain P6497) TaxID=1094619 RepID=G4ZHE3_PHYSP|nr:hypothetical protein PHYSODRAFT_331553 [Phytophthora sojae]EGZ17613.1 hypothetical protein PHYSODRAFT_331553 [Phytophthora sojae]|eukprot:XP_009526671.1 hypothetical protein PHYSODRAFT_331553 [Phytophthora sojae]
MKTFAILAALASVVALATAAEPLENDPAAHLEAAPAPGDAGAGPDDKEDFYGGGYRYGYGGYPRYGYGGYPRYGYGGYPRYGYGGYRYHYGQKTPRSIVT